MKACRPTRVNWCTAAAAAENGAILDRNMAGEHDVVRHDDVVADAAIMRDVRIGQEEIVVADDGLAAEIGGAGVHRDAFADRAVLTDT